MAVKCIHCGGLCTESNGMYECPFCGSTFSKSELAPKPTQSVPASSPAGQSGAISGADIFERCVNGVCEIVSGNSCGSGYLVGREGYVVTNSHVVANDSGRANINCTVKVAGHTVPGRVIAMGTEDNREHCSNKDLAIIKLSQVPFGATPLSFGDYSRARTGENIYVIGNSLGRGTCITGGIISDKDRNGQLMYDCATNPGNSGGPVFNAEGHIIGTHVAGAVATGRSVQGMNYAIPAPYVIELLRKCGVYV